eukprot:gene423-419_t
MVVLVEALEVVMEKVLVLVTAMERVLVLAMEAEEESVIH